MNPLKYGASFKSTTVRAANTPDTIFTPAANVRGAVLHLAQIAGGNAANTWSWSLLAKASAPTTMIDGDVIPLDVSAPQAAAYWGSGSLPREIFIPPGMGLYIISGSNESAVLKSALYTLL